MKEKKKAPFGLRLTAFLLALVLFLGVTWAGGRLLMPQRKEYGSLWEQYLREPENSLDLLFLGSSIAYCDVAPAWIWEESGLRSWVMAGPEQTLSLTYYYLREALKTQKPKLVVLEASALFFDKYQNYSRANVSTMPLSANRLRATLRAVEKAEWKGLLFPLYNYHGRWTEVRREELEEHLHPRQDALAGYMPLSRALPQTPRVNEDRVLQEAVYRENLRWLGRLREYCRKKETRLLLYLSPSAARTPPELTERIRADAEDMGIELWNLSDLAPELGIDNDLDWYDPLHFNISGAEKFSRWWGRTLKEEIAPAPGADAEAWEARLRELLRRREELQSG